METFSTPNFDYNNICISFLCFCLQEGGIIGLYRGFVPTLTGMVIAILLCYIESDAYQIFIHELFQIVQVPYAGFSFYCFESVKFLCMKYAPQYTCSRCEKNTGKHQNQYPKDICSAFFRLSVCLPLVIALTNLLKYFLWISFLKPLGIGGLVLNLPAKLLAGGLAGAIAQSFSYPLDVTRRRMQLAMMNPETAKFGYGLFCV